MIKPKALRKGDVIGIVSPSSDITRFPRRTQRSVEYLEKVGYRVRLMPNALQSDGYSGGSIEQRVDDIHNAFVDDEITAIICSTGGLTANALLPYLDYDLIRSNPKIFCGYSDISTLLMVITSRANLVTFHGPTLLPSFGDFEGSVPFTFEQFEQILSSKQPVGVLPTAGTYTIDNQFWDKEDIGPLKMTKAPGLISLGSDRKVEGLLFGGNLQTFASLVHEEDFFDLQGSILFLEEEGLSTEWYERFFIEIERSGVFDLINGLVIAKPSGSFKENNEAKRSLNMVLKDLGAKYDLPILANVDCGHTKPILTLPLGVLASMDTVSGDFCLLEPAVC